MFEAKPIFFKDRIKSYEFKTYAAASVKIKGGVNRNQRKWRRALLVLFEVSDHVDSGKFF